MYTTGRSGSSGGGQAQDKKKKRQWHGDVERRYYCALCNVWMGNDRASIALHENGRKHCENVQADLKRRRLEKEQATQHSKQVAATLAQMESSALRAATTTDVAIYGMAPPPPSPSPARTTALISDASASPPPPQSAAPPPPAAAAAASKTNKKKELASWNDRRAKRARGGDDDNDDNDDKGEEGASASATTTRALGDDEGHYTIGENTYLEGTVYASLLERDMPVEIWIGQADEVAVLMAKMRQDEFQPLWKTGLVAKVHSSSSSSGTCFNIAYLRHDDDDDETLEEKVPPHRLRLVLACHESVPTTVEEARLSLQGGVEEIQLQPSTKVDEATGLSGWGTVSIRRTTALQEAAEERQRWRQRKREEEDRIANRQRDEAARKMEEAKHQSADDSALGAYHVFDTSASSGYKGVDISHQVTLNVTETATKLATSQDNAKFKKTTSALANAANKKKKKKANRRTTTADD